MVIEIPFRAVTAMPISENPRRSRGFTIESLIGTDLERSSKRDSVCSQPAHHHHHNPPAHLPPPPPPPPSMGHVVSSNGALTSPLHPLGTNSLSSSSPSASSPSSSSSSLSSSSVSPNGNHLTAGSGGPVTSSSLPSKHPSKCTVDHTSNHITHQHSKNSIINSSNYSGSSSNNNNNNNRSSNNNCTSSSNGSSISTASNSNNNNKTNCNKQNSYNSISRSPSPITSHLSESGRSSSNNNINSTTSSSNDNNNNINGTGKSDGSPVNSRLVSVTNPHHYPQQQTPLGLVTHSLEKTLLEEKERYSHHQQHHHSPPSQNHQQNYHHHHHHHSPPIPGSSPAGLTGTTGSSPGLHYPLKCVQNTEDYYRGAASGFTPVRLCNHPLGSAVTVAAAAAAAAAAGTAPTWTGVLPPTSPAAAAAAAAAAMGPVNMSLYRDHTLFNPWMFARCAGYLGHRYPVNHDGAFLLPPYRKPKRIRTAFSPAQLLQLEDAFEKNHYVVGQERKELASDLKLTETQVKVWFQNRRTKHKRMKAEEEATSGSGGTTREEPTSSSRARPKEMDIDPTGMEPIEYDGSDENSDSEPMGIDT